MARKCPSPLSKPVGCQKPMLYQMKVFLKGIKFAPLKWSSPTAQYVCLLISIDWYHRWDWSSLSDWFISVFLKWFILTAGFTFLAALPPWFCLPCLSFPLYTLPPCAGLPLCTPPLPPSFFHHVWGGQHPPAATSKASVCAVNRTASWRSGGQTVHWFIPPALALLQRAEADSLVRVVLPTCLSGEARNRL